jgi:PKD repeat protein
VLRNILFAGVTLLSSVAAAERPHPTTHADGSVEVNGKVYASTYAWLTSPEFQAAGGRCGTPAPKIPMVLAPVAHGFPDCSDSATIINPAYNDGRAFVIQVVFHLIQKTDGTGNITDDQVKSQIQVLNDDYQAAANTHGAPGNNAGIKFVLARFDPTGNPTNGIERVTNDTYFSEGDAGTSAMKTALHWDTSRYLNVYSSGLDSVGLLGYATFPWDRTTNASNTAVDGVVLTYQSVGVNPAYTPYDLGASATHEIGHWFGLYHPFQGGCAGTGATAYTAGDLISDTPRDSTSHSGCTVTPSDCGDAGLFVPIENYMEYTDDSCMTEFTVEQVNRARCGIVHYRAINTEPTSLFTFTSAALVTTFTSTSTDAESTATQLHYNWDFGDGMTGTDQNPVHTYATAGSYDVTLEVIDPGSASATSKQTIVVSASGGGNGSGSGSGNGNGGGDAGISGGDDDGGGGSSPGGCCSANGGDLSFLLSGAPIAFVLLRRRRR